MGRQPIAEQPHRDHERRDQRDDLQRQIVVPMPPERRPHLGIARLRPMAHERHLAACSPPPVSPPPMPRISPPPCGEGLGVGGSPTDVMAGLVPAIHPSTTARARGLLDPRDKPEDDICGKVIASLPSRRRRALPTSSRSRRWLGPWHPSAGCPIHRASSPRRRGATSPCNEGSPTTQPPARRRRWMRQASPPLR